MRSTPVSEFEKRSAIDRILQDAVPIGGPTPEGM